ncbi:MAG: polysaccharide deacetylase family protein [Acidobacteriota bacterium]
MLILTYHSVDDSGSVISLPADRFARQMRFLKESGYRAVSLQTLCQMWDNQESTPPRTVVLTFDDGYANLKEAAFPILEEYGFEATVFVVAAHVGGYNNWPSQPPIVPHLPLLTWRDLRRLSRLGFEIAGHTLTHPVLAGISKEALAREIVRSKDMIEQRIGGPVQTFAYPYGVVDTKAYEAASAAYRAACTTEMGEVSAADDRYRLRRIDTYYLRRYLFFRSLDSALGRSYLSIRDFGRRCGARFRKRNRLGLAELT